MQVTGEVTQVADAIRLSVAPVFLLSGIGAMLAVMTNRLARIVDRARLHESRLPELAAEESRALHEHIATLSIRAKLISRAITFCTLTALLICAVVITLFVDAFLHVGTSTVIAALFIGAMSAFFTALLFLLREIFVATANLRIGPR
jgi:hypothetical protein